MKIPFEKYCQENPKRFGEAKLFWRSISKCWLAHRAMILQQYFGWDMVETILMRPDKLKAKVFDAFMYKNPKG